MTDSLTRPARDRTLSAPMGARGRWVLRDRPGVLWLVLAVAVALVHPFVPSSRWLMVHLVLLGALTHSIMVWSTHFSQALLKTPPTLDDRRVQSARLLTLLVGTTLVLVGVPSALWPLTVIGAAVVSGAVLWHGVQLWRRLRRALPGRFRITLRYYLAAAAMLPVGATLGTLLALGPDDAAHGRLLVAHSMVNLLGWVGLTMTGTLLTLWPTMLRTRIDPRAERWARQALPVLLVALGVIVSGALWGPRWSVSAGIGLYAVGLAWWGRALIAPARAKPPREFATASVGAALVWLAVGVVGVGVTVGGSTTWADVHDSFGPMTSVFVVGFAAQLLTGALSYLLPVVLGGGPSVLRVGKAWFDRWATVRLVLINGGLVLSLLPVPSAVRVATSVLVLLGLAAFVPLMLRAIRAGVQAKRAAMVSGESVRPAVEPVAGGTAPVWSGGQLMAALTALAVAVSVGVSMDPAAAGLGAASGGAGQPAVAATGQTTTVQVSARNMRFVPDTVTVPAGDRLVVELVNDDPSTTHDLLLNGKQTPRLMPGERATLDVGVMGADTDGWCAVIGHKQRGMTFAVLVEGATVAADDASAGAGSSSAAAAIPPAGAVVSAVDGAEVSAPVDPVLPPLTDERVHRQTLRAQEVELEVAPGVTQRRWTFNGRVPGPTLHGRVGDVFEITLVNEGTMGHSIDFHAGALAPDEPMRTIPPGQSLVYRFTAERAGVWMYHCGTDPVSAHIGAGMTGAVVIEPDGLPEVDRSYLLVQSDSYVTPPVADSEQPDAEGSGAAAAEVAADKVAAEQPDFVSFNGIANQYDQQPLTARVGERVRIWVLDSGPNRPTSFHVIGGLFDTVYAEGAYLLRDGRGPLDDLAATGQGGSQVLALSPGQGGFVELTMPEAGHYPIVSHLMVDAERGAHGILEVTD